MWICWKTYLLVIFCGEFCSSENHITPKEQEVPGLQGGYIMFPVQVSQHGNMRIEGQETLATVFEGRVRIEDQPRFKSRLRWDSQTGHFSLHNLTIADSGSYVIENTEGLKGKYNFKLTVYEQLSIPKATLHDNSSCTWTCSVENGRNVSLSWYEEHMLLKQTRNPDINTSLSLHLNLTSERLSSYNCVAANPIINVTFQLSSDHLPERCLASSSPDPEGKHIIYIPVLCVVCIIAVVGVVLCLRKRRNHIEAQSTNEEPQNDVQYSEILHTDLRTSQGEGQHIPELAAEGQESLLTSIYAKIQPHSPAATGTDSTVILGHL